MDFGGTVGTLATASVRAATSLTAGGLHIAPRYLTRTGDVDVSALGGFVNYPSSGGSLAGAQLSLQARLADGLVWLGDLGTRTSFGLRGPLWGDEQVTVGWDAHYRSDVYFYLDQGFGLSPAGFGLVPGMPGSWSQGAAAAVNGEYAWGPLRAYLSPTLAILSNRTSAGAALGLDWDLDRLTVGYGAALGYNAVANGTTTTFEQRHSAGARIYLTDWAYLQTNAHYQVADAYGEPTLAVLAGVGTRLLGNFTTPPVRVAAEPEPTPEPEPAATPEAEWDSLKGRVYHSLLPGGDPGKPLTVALKIRKGMNWVNAPETTRSDAQGRFVFHRLPDGDYQVVYRNEGGLDQVAGAAVSESARVREHYTRIRDLDVAWDERTITGTIKGNTVEVSWPPKATVKNLVYEVILKYAPEEPYIVGSPVSPQTSTRFDVSDEVKGRKLYFTVKYWKKGNKFMGASYYGQSDYQVLEVVK
jgi:hypothetical protein